MCTLDDMQHKRDQIASSNVIPRHLAEELASAAGCHWRTVMAAAEGRRVIGESGAKAQCVVADHFDLNPTMRPPGWKRPPHAPLPHMVAARIAEETKAPIEIVQRIAGGIPRYDELGTRIVEAIRQHYEAHPEDRPVPRSAKSATQVQP